MTSLNLKNIVSDNSLLIDTSKQLPDLCKNFFQIKSESLMEYMSLLIKMLAKFR